MRCIRCGWPSHEAVVMSTHRTSQGWVRYRRCVCGDVAIELVTLDPTAGTQVEPVRAWPRSERGLGAAAHG